jgi:hypothetical protein
MNDLADTPEVDNFNNEFVNGLKGTVSKWSTFIKEKILKQGAKYETQAFNWYKNLTPVGRLIPDVSEDVMYTTQRVLTEAAMIFVVPELVEPLLAELLSSQAGVALLEFGRGVQTSERIASIMETYHTIATNDGRIKYVFQLLSEHGYDLSNLRSNFLTVEKIQNLLNKLERAGNLTKEALTMLEDIQSKLSSPAAEEAIGSITRERKDPKLQQYSGELQYMNAFTDGPTSNITPMVLKIMGDNRYFVEGTYTGPLTYTGPVFEFDKDVVGLATTTSTTPATTGTTSTTPATTGTTTTTPATTGTTSTTPATTGTTTTTPATTGTTSTTPATTGTTTTPTTTTTPVTTTTTTTTGTSHRVLGKRKSETGETTHHSAKEHKSVSEKSAETQHHSFLQSEMGIFMSIFHSH